MSRIENALEKALAIRESIKEIVAKKPTAAEHMSRIENALDKALEIMGSTREVTAKEAPAERNIVCTGFEIGEGLVTPDKVDMHIVCVKDPCSAITEQYKKLRARILYATAKDLQNIIMVTSPDMGEGKTVTAINLAVAIANEVDYTVLLVDADLKRPSVHKYLGIEPECGLSDYLIGKAKLQDILIKTGIGRLVVLPAGKSSENTSESLSSERMKRLVKELKHRYKDRYVIFDSSPILVSADSISLSSYMDGIVFVVQATRTTPKTASRALSLIKSSNIIGAVFNAIPKDLARNLYPYYHLYGNEGYFKKPKKSGEIENLKSN